MTKYENGRIYKLVCNVTGLVYVGSTVQPLHKRRYVHASHFRRWQEGRQNYITSCQIIENGDYDIVLIEEVKCETKEQLHRVERKWIEALDCVNRYVPTRTDTEYRQDNREDIMKRRQAMYENNKDVILARKRESYQRHREKRLTAMKEYNRTHEDLRKAYNQIRFICPCGSDVVRHDKAQHLKTKKHQEWEQKQSSTTSHINDDKTSPSTSSCS